MLVLTCKVGQIIHLGDNITLEVVEVRHDKVRLAIVAPRHVPVWRKELVAEGQPLPPALSLRPQRAPPTPIAFTRKND